MHRLSAFAYLSTLYLASTAIRTRGTVLTSDDRRIRRIPLVRGRCPATLRALLCVLSEGWGHREGNHRHQKCRYRKDHKYAPHKSATSFLFEVVGCTTGSLRPSGALCTGRSSWPLPLLFSISLSRNSYTCHMAHFGARGYAITAYSPITEKEFSRKLGLRHSVFS